MTERKRLKAARRRKDYIKKRNILSQQMSEVKNGTRKGYSVRFPKTMRERRIEGKLKKQGLKIKK